MYLIFMNLKLLLKCKNNCLSEKKVAYVLVDIICIKILTRLVSNGINDLNIRTKYIRADNWHVVTMV